MYMEFQIAEAIHAEREAKRNHVVEGMTVQVPNLFERIIRAITSAGRNRAGASVIGIRPLSQSNAIAK